MEIYDISTGTTTTTDTLVSSAGRTTSQLYNGKIYIPPDYGSIMEIYDIASDTTTTIALTINMYHRISQLYNGKIYMPQYGGTIMEIYQFSSAAPLGAGICELGENPNGHYFKIKTGTGTGILVCFGIQTIALGSPNTIAIRFDSSGNTVYRMGTVYLPAEFSDNKYIHEITQMGFYLASEQGAMTPTSFPAYIFAGDDRVTSLTVRYLAIGFYTE